MSRKRTCPFCGGSPLTREHVLPQWLKQIVPFEPTTGVGLRNRKTLPISPSERVARHFCGPCNTGWMAELEAKARPLLTPLILGETRPRRLKPSMLEVTAFWAAKTVLTCQYVNDPTGRFVPQEACREMLEAQAPPAGTRVWFAPHVGDVWSVMFHLEPIPLWVNDEPKEYDDKGRLRVRSYTATLGLGHLLIHVLYFGGAELPLDDPSNFDATAPLIWPITRGITWPPGPPLSNREATELAGILPRGLRGVDEILDKPTERAGPAIT